MGQVLEFFGIGATDRPDDITLVVACIPAQASFARQPQDSAA